MSACCEWCEKGRDEGWPPADPNWLCIECLTEWERDVAVDLLRRLWAYDCIRTANDQGFENGGYPSSELHRDRAAVEAFLERRRR